MTALNDLPQYDSIHVISDIHMGGEQGFQILREGKRLANYILRLATTSPESKLALILNGDIFDTLAESSADYVAIQQAATIVSRIMDDPSFKDTWDALATFARTPRRTLVLVIGNHDIELAFPPVQRLILRRLAGDDVSARGRVEFSIMGAGYACMVGSSRVFCAHGNEVDAWNYNRYEDLARVARRLNAGRPFDPAEWQANAGTRMVKDVMNTVKRTYAWIDLLKPENSAAVGTLMVIDPNQLTKLGKLVGVIGERDRGGVEYEGRLSVDSFASPTTVAAPDALEGLLGANLRSATVARSTADEMLLAAEQDLHGSQGIETDGTLGTGQLIIDRLTGWLRGIDKREALRRALLDWLKNDSTFALDQKDDTCIEVMNNVGPAIDIVITGHTHLARAIDLGGGRLYFNSGTWIRLMQFTEDMLRDSASFQPVYEALLDGRMSTLDKPLVNGKPLLLDRTSEIQITQRDGATVGRLNWITGDGTGEPTNAAELRR